MNRNDRYIIELSRAAIFDDVPAQPDAQIDWEYIYKKSISQNITGLLYTSVVKIAKEQQPDAKLMHDWQKNMLGTIAVNANRYNEFLKMSKIINDKKIKMVGLKGCLLRELYPVPELRTMGDFDVLVSKASIDATKTIFTDNEYNVIKDSYGIVCENKKAYWEVFYGLDEEFAFDSVMYTEKVFNSAEHNGTIYCPEITYFLAHVIIHSARHYMEKGAGIRNICDIALVVDKYKEKIDFKLLENLCIEQNYRNIYGYIINSINKYYKVDVSGIDIEDRNCDKFLEYALLNGVYGKHGNSLLWQVAKDENENNRGLKRLLFPSVESLKNRYKYLNTAPILLPIAWIHRLFSALFKWKYSFKQMKGDMKEAFEFSDERIKWMKDLGLQDKH
ncbi:MAG: nucleotidyltransferase family protein [Alphaproteobacteria bacterium]|nr:nucleotidyltransferase family protein [Alphaproteobacteria bacterium]